MADQDRNETVIKKEIAEVEKKLSAIESALFKARKITKAVKYENPATDIIVQVKGLMSKDLAVDPTELEAAENAVIEASNKLESAIYGLDEVFAEAHRNLKLQHDELESELSDIEYNKKYGRESMQEMRDYALKPGDKVYVKNEIGSDRVIRVVGDQVYLQKAGKASMRDVSRANPGLGSQIGDVASDIGKGLKNFFTSKEPFERESQGTQGDISGSNQPDTTSVISGRNKNENPGLKAVGENKEQVMKDDLSVESLRYLAGVKETIAECGMMPGSTPASIAITAGSGPELAGMLKDIMSLAGVHKVGPVGSDHMPLDTAPGPSAVISAPPMSGTGQGPSIKDMIAIVDEPKTSSADSMNGQDDDQSTPKVNPKPNDESSKEEDVEQEAYDNSPDEKTIANPFTRLGDINSGDHRERQKGLPVAKPMESTVDSLYTEYQKFISESVVSEKWAPKAKNPAGEKSPSAGKSASQIQSEIDSIKSKGPTKKGSPDQKKLQSLQLAKRNKAKAKKVVEEQKDESVEEGKPSAGMSAKEKSAVVKKAKKGGDIGKPGKGFAKVEKAAKKSGAKDPKAVAAAAMWKQQAKK